MSKAPGWCVIHHLDFFPFVIMYPIALQVLEPTFAVKSPEYIEIWSEDDAGMVGAGACGVFHTMFSHHVG